MSEKTSEFYLRDIIYKNTEKKYIFESTNDNIILKNVHAKNSKIGNGRGIPDLNYLDDLIEIGTGGLNKASAVCSLNLYATWHKRSLSSVPVVSVSKKIKFSLFIFKLKIYVFIIL